MTRTSSGSKVSGLAVFGPRGSGSFRVDQREASQPETQDLARGGIVARKARGVLHQRGIATDAIEQISLLTQLDAEHSGEIARQVPSARLYGQRQPFPHEPVVHAAAFDPGREQRIATLRL